MSRTASYISMKTPWINHPRTLYRKGNHGMVEFFCNNERKWVESFYLANDFLSKASGLVKI